MYSSFAYSSLRPSEVSAKRLYKTKKSKVPKIRVRIGKSISNVELSGLDLQRELLLSEDLQRYDGRKKLSFNCSNFKNSKKFKASTLFASISSQTGLISFGEEKYQGKISILTSPNRKSCDVVNEVSIELYLSSLLSKEMNAKWPIEALKAQAIAARTYAIHKMKSRQVSRGLGREAYYDIESSEKHQVGGSFFDATKNTFKAARYTKGKILVTQKGKNLTPIFFHAKCGGRTLLPDQVWDNHVEGYHGVPCPHCHGHGKKSWDSKVSKKRLKKFISWAISESYLKNVKEDKFSYQDIMVAPDRIKNFKIRIYLGDKVYVFEKTLLRRYFGRSIIPSNNFYVRDAKNSVKLSGRGNGHGVGMCQLGALHMAKMGKSYKEILAYYFPGHELRTIY
jgi:stage II sporulation protein D